MSLKSNHYTAEGRKQTSLDTIRAAQDGLLREKFEKVAASSFETDVAFLLFSSFGLPAQVKWQLTGECESRSGEKGLKLEAVFDRYPQLPFRLLSTGRFRKLPQTLTISQLFSTFSTQPFVLAWNRFYDAMPRGDRKSMTVGLVHYWPFVSHHAMVLHNRPPSLDRPGVRVYCVGREDKKKRVLTWEPLINFFQSIDWKLEEETQND